MSTEMDTEKKEEKAPSNYTKLPDYAALTIKEVCALAGIGRSTFYNEVAAGRITPTKIGDRTLVLVQDLRDYMLSRRVPPAVTGEAA